MTDLEGEVVVTVGAGLIQGCMNDEPREGTILQVMAPRPRLHLVGLLGGCLPGMRSVSVQPPSGSALR